MPVASWTSLYNATVSRPGCLQTYEDPLDPVPEMSEDCLYLDVYTPSAAAAATATAPLQVIVWIHGKRVRTS